MKYTTLASVKTFGRAQTPVGQSSNTLDDAAITAAIARAEEEVDCSTGTAFDRKTNVLELVPVCWVTDGWLYLHLRYPVSSVSYVEVLNMRDGATTFSPLASTLEFPQDPLLEGEGPLPGAWVYLYQATPVLPDAPRGRLRCHVSYVSGYLNTPPALQAMTDRLAWWYYQIREMPMGRVADLASNTITSPLGLPRDFEDQIKSWKRLPL
jgi:hypothetical protein